MFSRSIFRRVALAIAALACLGRVAPADDPFDPVRERINKAIVDTNLPSMAVAVAREGKIIWEQGFGWADRENRVPATEHTLYSLASISKPITATGLMVLLDHGALDLDKPANDYLGDAKLVARVGDPAGATLRRIANHTSGLPLHYQFFYVDESYRAPSADETIRRYGNLVTPPGEHYQYSNLGYGVLDYVIARKSNKKFADFMREEVFLPLGLTHTSIDIGPGLEPHQAIRYTREGARIPFYDFDHPGASAVYSSAHDLVRFAMFHLKEHLPDQKPILKDATIDEMQQPTSRPREGGGYGVGWGQGTSRGYRTVSHSGGMPGVSTLCTLYPSERLAIVVLANTGTPLDSRINEMIAKTLLPRDKSPADKVLFAERAAPSGSASAESEQPKSDRLLGKWKGELVTFHKTFPLVFNVKALDDVHVKLGSQLETLLNGPVFVGGALVGRFAGDIDHQDARGHKYLLAVELNLRGDVLNGPVTAHLDFDGRGSSAVTQWIELKREAEPAKEPAAAGN
jgi:CubicO group peptidase (beta-lactamase class C family)